MDFRKIARQIHSCDSKQSMIRLLEDSICTNNEVYDGGPGSGNFGHKGRPSKRGGSAKRGSGGGSETLKRQATAAAKLADNDKFKKSVQRALGRLSAGATICSGQQDNGGWSFRKGDDGLWRLPDDDSGLTDQQLSRSISFDDQDTFYRAATAKQAEKYDQQHAQFVKPKQEKPKQEKPKRERKPRQKSPFKKHKVSQGVYQYEMEDGRDFQISDSGIRIKSKYDDYISAVYYDSQGWVVYKTDPDSDWQDQIQLGMHKAKISDVLAKIAQLSDADGVGAGKARLSDGKIYKHRYSRKQPFGNGTQGGVHIRTQADIYETEDGISVCVMRNMDKKKQTMDIPKFMGALQKIPTSLKNKAQKRIEIVDYQNPRDPYWRQKYKDFRCSYATGGFNDITFYGTGSTHSYDGYLIKAICHEMGHGLDEKTGRISSTKQWTDAMQSDKIVSGMSHVSVYGSNADVEDFADSVMKYVRQSDTFRKNFPARYKIIQRYLGG